MSGVGSKRFRNVKYSSPSYIIISCLSLTVPLYTSHDERYVLYTIIVCCTICIVLVLGILAAVLCNRDVQYGSQMACTQIDRYGST